MHLRLTAFTCFCIALLWFVGIQPASAQLQQNFDIEDYFAQYGFSGIGMAQMHNYGFAILALDRVIEGNSPVSMTISRYNRSGTRVWARRLTTTDVFTNFNMNRDSLLLTAWNSGGNFTTLALTQNAANPLQKQYATPGITLTPRKTAVDSVGHFYVGGNVTGTGAGGTDVFVIKMDSAANVLWAKTYGSTGNQTLNDIEYTPTGRLALLGPGFLFEIDTSGSYIRGTTYGPSTFQLKQLSGGPNGDYGATGQLSAATPTHVVARFDQNLNVAWAKRGYSSAINVFTTFHDVVYDSYDGNFIFVGSHDSAISNIDFEMQFLLKLDAAGNRVGSYTNFGFGMNDHNEALVARLVAPGFIALLMPHRIYTMLPYPHVTSYARWDMRLLPGGFGACGKVSYVPARYPVSMSSTPVTFTVGTFSMPAPTVTVPTLSTINTNSTGSVCCPLPTVNFTSSINGLDVQFTGNVGNADSIRYDFGDGTSSTSMNPLHTFPAPIAYNVCLTAYNGCGNSTFCATVDLCQLAAYTGDTIGCLGDTVVYTANPSAQTFAWYLNGTLVGTSSTYSHPLNQAGLATLTLVAGSAVCTDTVTHSILTRTVPNANFTWVALTSPLMRVQFTNATTNTPATYIWQFGTGATSTATSPAYTYPSGNPYTACLLATNVCGTDTACQTVTPYCPAPAPSFTWTASNLAATVTNTTPTPAGTVNFYTLNFGDGFSVPPGVTTNHTYASPGTYSVCLTYGTICDTVTVCQSITVTCPAPVAAFGTSSSQLTSTFSNTSTGSFALSYSWDFGDGNASTQQNPQHTYAAPGTYMVCLITTDLCGADTICQQLTVTCAAPIAGYSLSASQLAVNFTNASTGGFAQSYAWDFGDGNASTQQNPQHTYAAPGTYMVCLIVIDLCGADTTCQQLTVTCAAPIAGYSLSASQLAVNFTNTSTGSFALSYAWDFGDGNASTQQSPQHTYAAPGTYMVCLITTDLCGADTSCQQVTVTCTAPVAVFSANSSQLAVAFTNSSTGSFALSYAWDFGDGNTSTQQHPQHTYAIPGTYTVCLSATDTCGTDTACQQVTVTQVAIAPASPISIAAFPIPADAKIHLTVQSLVLDRVRIRAYAADGKCMGTWALAAASTHHLTLDVARWPNGVYLLEVSAGESQARKRLLIQR